MARTADGSRAVTSTWSPGAELEELRAAQRAKTAANGRAGMVLAVVAETVFFVSLVFVTVSVRRGATQWPPAGSPELDVPLLIATTVVLLLSAATMVAAQRLLRAGRGKLAALAACSTAALGAAFLAGQWLQFEAIGGWQTGGSLLPVLFNILSGFHALHVGIGLALLLVLLLRWRLGQVTPPRATVFDVAALWWYFVSGIWVPLLAAVVVA